MSRWRCNRHALLRRESFGGTLFLVDSGKRAYVDTQEFLQLKIEGWLWEDLALELKTSPCQVLVTEPTILPSGSFSSPDTVFLEVTSGCNLRCTHCFNVSGKAHPEELSDTELVSIIDDLATTGVQEIRFTGGEPLVRSSLASLIAYAADLGLRCSMGTNATMITSRKALELKEAGLRSAIVSIEGLQRRHDEIRGRGSYARTMDGLERLLAHEIAVRVNVVAMQSNLADLRPLLEQMAERGIPVFVRRLITAGRAAETQKEMLTAVQYEGLRSELRHLLGDPRGLIDGHHLSNHPPIVTRIPLPFERKDCSAGQRGLVVLPNGNVQTCGFLGPLGEPSIGSLRSERLKDIWQRLSVSGHIERLGRALAPYNCSTQCPKTNCLAIALAAQMVGNHEVSR